MMPLSKASSGADIQNDDWKYVTYSKIVELFIGTVCSISVHLVAEDIEQIDIFPDNYATLNIWDSRMPPEGETECLGQDEALNQSSKIIARL